MALTRPKARQIITTVNAVTDPLTVLNKDATTAAQDVGFLINRDGGATANAAIFWDETNDQFVLGLTTASGINDANLTIDSGYGNLKVDVISSGNILASGNVAASYYFGNGSQLTGIITSVTQIINGTSDITVYENSNIAVSVSGTANTVVFGELYTEITGSLLPSANITYDLGSPTQRWRDGYFSGNTIYLGNAVLSSSGQDIVISTSGGFGVPTGTTAERTTTVGAIRFNTDQTKFETYDGIVWNTLAYGTVSDFPSGDYGDVSTVTSDAFGVPLATTFNMNESGAISTTDLGAEETYVGA